MGEVVGTIGTGRGQDTILIRSGVTYQLSKGIMLVAAAAGGLTPDSPEAIFRTGVTIGF